MAKRVFWNRRKGRDRRRPDEQEPEDDRRFSERRSPGSDNYILVVGSGGLDAFGLISLIAIGVLLLLVLLGGIGGLL